MPSDQNPLTAEQTTGPTPRRKFTDEAVTRMQDAIERTLVTVPELAGIAVAFIWNPQLGSIDPHSLIVGTDVSNPNFVLRSMEQTWKLLRGQTEQFQQMLRAAEQAALKIDRELNDKREQLQKVEAKQKEASTEGSNPDTSGAPDPS